ncbi:MAG: DUF1501 domain-containing protein, partial [Bryobacteraceae bacterium]
RRQTLRLGGVTMAGYHFLPLIEPTQVRAEGVAKPRGSARFCIFVMLTGGPSHVDSFDLKEGKWTPPDFDIRTVKPGVKMPVSLYPQLSQRLDRLAIVRSMEAWDSVHERAQYYIQAAHPLNLALWKEIPPVGAVVAMEYAARRKSSDSLPPYVAFNTAESQAGLLGSGFLPATYAPFHMKTDMDLAAFAPPDTDRQEFQRRWEFLKRFDSRLRSDTSLAAKAYRDFHNHYEGAVSLMSDPRAARILQTSAEDRARYGSSITGDAAILARNLVVADAGTHFIFLSQEGWDHHNDIYDAKNHYRLSRHLDAALAALLDDLAAAKRSDGKSALDETLVVAMGEFGRTPGELSPQRNGREHYQYAFSALFAGGGVQGDRIIGRTDEAGAKVVDTGWHARRSVYIEDVATTIYSALGIDWRKKIEATPSGRSFFYVEPFSATTIMGNDEVRELFA